MSQIAYGTITITDTNDIESIIIEYARNQDPSNAPSSGWSTTRPAWAQGYYIWQRTRTHKAGTSEDADIRGTAVCITGSTGATGAAGRSLSSTVTHYTIATSSATINQGNMGSYTWTTNVPSYNASYPTYWVRVTNTYSNPSSTEYIFYKDQGITDAIKTSNDANTTAGQAKTTANEAKEIAQQASADVTNLQTRTKYFWTNLVAKTGYPVGTYAASGIDGVTFDYENSSTYGYNTLYSNGINLRYNAINLGQLTGSSLIFYNPSTSSQGTKAMELSGSSLKFYASDGTTAQAEFGGTQARVEGQLIAQSGYIGTNVTNRWFIGNRKNYDQTNSAALLSYGNAYIQLGEDGCWRLSTNRLHTGWNASSGSNVLHYPKWNNIYWDFGIHAPTQSANKFIYIRNYDSTDSGLTEAQILADLQDNFESNVSVVDSWQYRFYVTAEGSLYAKNIYVLDDNGNATQIGGTDGVYLLKSGGTITGDLEVNGALTKGSKNVAYLSTTPMNGQILIADGTGGGIKTSGYTIATSVPSNAVFTDKNVQTDLNNSTRIYLAGPTTTATNTGTLTFDSNVYVDTTAGALHATTFNGYTLAAAAAKGVDTSMTSTSTSTNLPTTKAVADLIATYLPLAGGTVSGAVDINDELYADSATFGNLIVNGVGRFTNGLYGDLTGNVTGSITGNAATADKVNHNLVIKLASGTTEGTNMFTFNGSVAKTVDITKSALGLGNVENKSSATIRGELTSANVTTALGFTPYNSTNPNGYTTNVGTITGVTAGTGLSGGGTSGTVTLNHSNSVTAQTTQGIYPIKIDAQGHISAYGSAPTTLSGYGITDAKIANGVITLGSNTITPLTSQWTANLYVGKTATDKANAAATNGNVYLNLVENNTVRNAHNLVGANGLTITTADTSGTITFTSPSAFTDVQAVNIGTETNPQYVLRFTKSGGGTVDVSTANIAVVQSEGANRLVSTSEPNGLTVAGPVKFSNGVPITMKPNSSAGQFLKDDGTWATPTNTNTTYTLTNALSSHKFTWTLTAGGSGSGSTTTALELVQGNNITLTDDTTNKKITIAAKDTTYSAGNGLRLNGTQFINTRIPFVVGTQTAATGSWTGVCNDITALYDGLTIAYWLPYGGSGNATLNLTINGTETGAKNCYYGGTTRLTTHFSAGNIIYLTYRSTGNINGTNYEGWWANANYYTNNLYQQYNYYGIPITDNSTRYGMYLTNKDGNYVPIYTTDNQPSKMDKVLNTRPFDPFGLIGYKSANNAETANTRISYVYYQILADLRYSFNVTNASGKCLTANQPVYIVATPQADGQAILTEPYLTQTLPNTDDGKIYIYLGMVYPDTYPYRCEIINPHPVYWYKNGAVRPYISDASTVNGHTVGIDVPSNAKFTDTWNALSTSQAGYVAKAPNDTGKFLRGDATWATVTKANVGLSNVDNTADANKRVKGANITTTANAVAKYSDTNGTFADSTTTFDGNNLIIGSTDNPGNLKIGAKNDNYGLMPNTSNYNQIGSSSLYWYRSYITHYYGTQSHITNWDAGKNIGTAVTSGAASTLGSVNFYNTCAAGGTQTKTLLTADSTANSNVTITLPKTTGTLALTSEIPTNYVTLNTVQNITANKIFSNGVKFTTETNTTTPSKYGAVHYDSTLEALVFSFA